MSAIKSKLNPWSDEFQATAGAMAGLVADLREKVERASPEETRRALALAISASFDAPIEETRFGVFRM